MRSLRDRLRCRLPGLFPEEPPDPFRTLELQARLSRLASELDGLGRDGKREFALGHHAKAALMAYEQTLDDACRLAGLPEREDGDPTHRLLAEARLLQAGWQW